MPETKVLVGGCFDLLHFGHLTFLNKAKALGDRLIVFLESDDFIRQHKHREPIHSQRQRAEILRALRMVDEVVELPLLPPTFEAYLEAIQKTSPQIIAITENDTQRKNKVKQAQMIGAKLVTVTTRIEGYSTSSIIKTLTRLD